MSDDPGKDPFQDIAVGGTAIPGRDPGYLAVWAVTFQGKVVYSFEIFQICMLFLSFFQENKSTLMLCLFIFKVVLSLVR